MQSVAHALGDGGKFPFTKGTGYMYPGVQGTGYGVRGTGYRVQGTGYRVQGTGFSEGVNIKIFFLIIKFIPRD